MSGNWPIVLRDPIHNLIAFHDTPWDRLLLSLLDAREVQRLRRIKQLGFSELVFPGANHSRLAHSLGVLHVTKKFLAQFDLVTGRPLNEYQRCLMLAAALLHDIGHGPFSHAFEQVTGIKHERFTHEIIVDPETQVHQRLRAVDGQLPAHLTHFFPEQEATSAPPADLPLYLTHVISGQFDADRCDYLLRDSHATGTEYGRYDLEWLLSHLQPQADGRRFYLSRKALSAVEAYIFARFHMYRTVYFHKTTRAAEMMLTLLFRRFRQLLGDNPSVKKAQKIVPEAPRSVLAVCTGQMQLSWYTRIDEHSITEFLKGCEEARDPILQELGGGIVHRDLYKVIDVTDLPRGKIGTFAAAVQNRLQQEPHAGYLFVNDSPQDTPYKPYNPDEVTQVNQIYLEDATGKPQEISLLSRTVAQLRDKYEFARYYFPKRLRTDIEAIAQSTLKKE
jgi:HD superfamily phosphohydrolase